MLDMCCAGTQVKGHTKNLITITSQIHVLLPSRDARTPPAVEDVEGQAAHVSSSAMPEDPSSDLGSGMYFRGHHLTTLHLLS